MRSLSVTATTTGFQRGLSLSVWNTNTATEMEIIHYFLYLSKMFGQKCPNKQPMFNGWHSKAYGWRISGSSGLVNFLFFFKLSTIHAFLKINNGLTDSETWWKLKALDIRLQCMLNEYLMCNMNVMRLFHLCERFLDDSHQSSDPLWEPLKARHSWLQYPFSNELKPPTASLLLLGSYDE